MTPPGWILSRAATALLVLNLAGCQGQTSSEGASVAPPSRGAKIAALGKLEPRDRVIDVSVAGDQRLASIAVKEGQQVKAGDILASFQSRETLTAARDRAAAQLENAKSRLQADTDQAQARIQEASLRVKQMMEVPALEIQAQAARIRAARADLDLAMLNLERLRELVEPGLIPRQDFDRQSALVTRLRATLDTEEATLQKLERSADSDRKAAEALLATRAAELQGVRPSAQIETLKSALRVAESELQDSVVRAPSDGRIIEILASPGESVSNRVILRLGDVSQMYALAEVYETDMAGVQLGQSVDVSSPALSKKLTGSVDRLGTSVFKRQVRSLDPQADADARVVQVRVRLDNSEEAARFVGLQVDLLFHTGN